MKLIVTVAVGDSTVPVRCAYIEHDQLLDGNVRLVGCEELETQNADGSAWATVVWSIPRRSIVSYAAGEPANQPVPVPAPEIDPETQERARQRREEIREADRVLMDLARERIASRRAQGPTAEKRTRAKRPGRGQRTTPVAKPAPETPTAG